MINIFLFSHSFLDMAFVLGYCAKYDKQRNITILVSGSRENMSFLEEYFPYRANIRFLDFKTKNPNLKLGKIEFIFALFQEKFLLQKLKKEILKNLFLLSLGRAVGLIPLLWAQGLYPLPKKH